MFAPLRSWLGRSARPAARPRARLRLDHLEDRTVPAGLFDPSFAAGFVEPGEGGAFGLTNNRTTANGDVTADAAGNVYVTGYFRDLIDFDPRPDSTYVLSGPNATTAMMYAAKYAPDGGLVWVWAVPNGTPRNMAVGSDGSVYLTGFSSDAADFDPATTYPDNRDLVPGGPTSWVARLTADGSFAWVRAVGGYAEANDVAVDGGGNAYYTRDSNVGKLDAASGAPVWVGTLAGTGWATAVAVAVDPAGTNVVVTGKFAGKVDFNPGSAKFELNGGGTASAFVLKLSGGGQFGWASAFQAGGRAEATGTAVALDAAGNVYTAGYFGGSVDFDPGKGSYALSNSGGYNLYLSRLSPAGAHQWARRVGGQGGHTKMVHLAVSPDASALYLAGSFSGTADFDATGAAAGGADVLTSAGGTDAFVARFDPATGGFRWVTGMGAAGDDGARGVAVAPAGGVYVGGEYAPGASFGGLAVPATAGISTFVARVVESTPPDLAAAPSQNTSASTFYAAPDPVQPGETLTLDAWSAGVGE